MVGNIRVPKGAEHIQIEAQVTDIRIFNSLSEEKNCRIAHKVRDGSLIIYIEECKPRRHH